MDLYLKGLCHPDLSLLPVTERLLVPEEAPLQPLHLRSRGGPLLLQLPHPHLQTAGYWRSQHENVARWERTRGISEKELQNPITVGFVNEVEHGPHSRGRLLSSMPSAVCSAAWPEVKVPYEYITLLWHPSNFL